MKILVTGGLGFIGSHTCCCLVEEGYDVVVIDNLAMDSLKTKQVKDLLTKLDLAGKVLFVTKEDNENLFMATRNLGYTYQILAEEINCYDIVNSDYLVCDEAAINYIEEVLK